MDSVDLEVLRAATQWCAAGHLTLLGTVVRTWGSAPRPPGSLIAIREDGQVRGSVSGGCIEDDLIDKVRTGELRPLTPLTQTYGISADEAHRFGLPCGGTLQIVLEPIGAQSQLQPLLDAVLAYQLVTRELDLATGVASLRAGSHAPQPIYDGQVATLKRFQDDASEVRAGLECGIRLGDFNEYLPDDTIECYQLEKVAQTL